MATPKIIPYQVKLRSTTIERSLVRPIVYTNDLRSAEFQFQVTDMQAGELSGATATTLLYMRDGSFFQNPKEDVELTGTTFSYLLKEDEGNHAGIARIQLVVRFNEGLEDEQNFPSQLYDFEIVNGLETQVAQQIMIHDWTTLTREARAYIDEFAANEILREAEFDNNEFDRNAAFNLAQTNRQNQFSDLTEDLTATLAAADANIEEFDVALQNGIVAANLAEKLEDFEEINNSRLLSTERQLEQKPSFSQMEEVVGHGYLSGFKVTQQTTPNMTIKVENGIVYMPNGNRWVVAINNNLAINAADATNPRKDIVYVNSLGVTSYTAGTPSATPVAPNVPSGGLIIAELYIPANVTAVTDYFITDKKVMRFDNNALFTQITTNEKRLPIFNAIQIEKMGTYHTDNKYTYTSFFSGANIRGKEVHVGRTGTDHTGYDTCLVAYIRNDDGTFTKKKLNGIDYTLGDFRDPHLTVLTSGAVVMTVSVKKTDGSYTNVYVNLDSDLNVTNSREIFGMENHFVWGNCIEQSDGSVLTCAYFSTNAPLYGVYLFKIKSDGVSLQATKAAEVFPPETNGPGESTISVWGRKLVCVSRRNTNNMKWRETYDLTGATGWGDIIDLGFIAHAPAIPPIIKEGDPMLLTACYINIGGATTNGRNPFIKIFYDVSEIGSSPTILLDDRANNGGYNSLVPNREGYGLMWYQEQALGRTSVFYKEINLKSLQHELLLKHVRSEAVATLDWTDVASFFINGWSQQSVPTRARKLKNGNIQIKGQVTGTSFADGTTIATLPAHLRPQYNIYATAHTIGVKPISLVLYPSGDIRIYNVTAAGALVLNTTFVN